MSIILARRSFLTGLASLICAPAIVRAENIMPVRAIILRGTVTVSHDPSVRGIIWQSWPYGAERPEYFAEGSIGLECKARFRPLSKLVDRLDDYKAFWPGLEWRPVPDRLSDGD